MGRLVRTIDSCHLSSTSQNIKEKSHFSTPNPRRVILLMRHTSIARLRGLTCKTCERGRQFTRFLFHIFTFRILGDVSRLTLLVIDQQSSHTSSRGAPPGFAPARYLRTHAIRSMTLKADRQTSLLKPRYIMGGPSQRGQEPGMQRGSSRPQLPGQRPP